MNGFQDNFSWIVEGLLILIVGCIGLFGNTCSIGVFSRQRDQRVFHHLLLLLAIFDMIYIISSMMIFSLPKFSDQYANVYLTYLLPYILPVAHVGLMGSTYSTLVLGIERYLAVCHPFLSRRRLFKTRWFVIPVVVLTLLYNIPKFFELNLVSTPVAVNGTHANFTNTSQLYRVSIEPSEMRLNKLYIVIYIFWTNLVVNLLAPFVVLIILNFKTYWQIKEFERTLVTNQINVSFHRRRQRSPQNLTLTTRAMSDEDDQGIHNTTPDTIIQDPQPDQTPTLQEELKKLFDKSANPQGDETHPKGRIYKLNIGSFKSMKKKHASQSLDDESQDVVVAIAPKVEIAKPRTRDTEALTRANGPSQAESLRKREVALARISLYIVFVFLLCHCIRLIPNTFEMIQTYLSGHGDDPEDFPWPQWVDCMSNISHLLLTVTSSANFYIYFFKHGRAFYARCKSNYKSSFPVVRNTSLV